VAAVDARTPVVGTPVLPSASTRTRTANVALCMGAPSEGVAPFRGCVLLKIASVLVAVSHDG